MVSLCSRCCGGIVSSFSKGGTIGEITIVVMVVVGLVVSVVRLVVSMVVRLVVVVTVTKRMVVIVRGGSGIRGVLYK